jgi:hypothetical protein
MKPLLIGIAFASAALATDPASFHSGAHSAPPPHPSMYSFADVYRLTVAGPMAGLPALDTAPDAPIRVAVAQARELEPRFTVKPLRQPDKWLLVIAGVALCGWVAHRRLVHSL